MVDRVGVGDAHRGEPAAMICEPIVANNACTMPVPGYLETLREECTRRGIVLILDEVCTGFRTGSGGAQGLFGALPDLAVCAEALGGGLPIAAFAGRRDIMDEVGTNRIKHGGTYNGSPLCASGALVTLGELADPAVIEHIDAAGNRVLERGVHVTRSVRRAGSCPRRSPTTTYRPRVVRWMRRSYCSRGCEGVGGRRTDGPPSAVRGSVGCRTRGSPTGRPGP
ncbi:aminotransferase class III-fold pyridoxal phosphate-dependent enzyme [Embleya sp. NPDC005575]|uniref:aminotransferase class III-fold pyridoxal phosphate-dependent enzyme n=1 Tax=Embleya sp. NPDC005575 TaxID=3156892 RepID=UPI0033B76241